MRNPGRPDDPGDLQLWLGAELVKQPNAAAEQERGDVDLEPVDQPGPRYC